MKLTKRAIDSFIYSGDGHAKAADVRWDDSLPGFGIRIYPSGKKSFLISYRHMGRKRRMTLGAFGVLTLDQARGMAKRKLAEVIEGEDPSEAKRDRDKSRTMGELCAAYIKRHVPMKKSGRDDVQRINRHILPKWKAVPVKTITHNDVADLFHTIGKRTPYEANRTLALLAKMFKLARQWDFVPKDHPLPTQDIKRYREKKRDRWVTHEEMPRLAEAIDQVDNIYVRAALWLYLLTGARKAELLSARWADVDWLGEELRIPETKAGRTHYIPLSGAALKILNALPRLQENKHIFPGRRAGRPLVNIAKPWDKVRKTAGIEDVRIHDLRRTVGSYLAQDGYSLHLIGKVLNHSNPSTTAVYARFSQDPIRGALEKHTEKILSLIPKRPVKRK